MKKITVFCLSLLVIAVFLTGCSGLGGKPFPFSDAKWSSSKSDVVKIMGSDPDEEYDTDDGLHVLQFNDCKYDEYSGLIRYCYKDDKLAQVIFEFDEYSDETLNHFNDEFTSKYGEPDFNNEAGKVWYDGDLSIGLAGVSIFDSGMLMVSYTNTKITSEE